MKQGFSNQQQRLITSTVKRQLMDHCHDFFVQETTAILLSECFYDIYKSTPKEYVLVVANPENPMSEGEASFSPDTYRNTILGNKSFAIIHNRWWEYVLADDEGDLNLLRLSMKSGDHVIVDLKDIKEQLRNT